MLYLLVVMLVLRLVNNKFIKIVSTLNVLTILLIIQNPKLNAFSYQAPKETKTTSFHKTRAKQMSEKEKRSNKSKKKENWSSKYSYTVIKTAKQAKRFEDECRRIGLNTNSKDRGTKINYVYIKNVRLNCERGKTNLGIKSDGLSRGKYINSVTVKNSEIDGGNVNLGIKINKYRGETLNSGMENRVSVKKSKVNNNNETMKEKIVRKYMNSAW